MNTQGERKKHRFYAYKLCWYSITGGDLWNLAKCSHSSHIDQNALAQRNGTGRMDARIIGQDKQLMPTSNPIYFVIRDGTTPQRQIVAVDWEMCEQVAAYESILHEYYGKYMGSCS